MPHRAIVEPMPFVPISQISNPASNWNTTIGAKFNKLTICGACLSSPGLRLAYGLIGDSALQSTREPIGRRLFLLAHGDGTQASSERTSIATSQDNLAMMLGISLSTLNLELQASAKLGAITLRYGRIEINDPQLLLAGGTRIEQPQVT